MDEDGLGDLRYLPDDEFRMVLPYLKFADIGNMRCVSKGLKKHVTKLYKSLFNTLHIKEIDEGECEGISQSLVMAMAEDHAPEKLELEFELELTPVMKQMLLDYMELISSLGIFMIGNNTELLLLQSTHFESLESLTLQCWDRNVENYSVIVAACEAMLAKHAHNLKHLEVNHLEKNLFVPALPVIDSLVLNNVENEAAQSLYEQSRNTITTLKLGYCVKLSNLETYKIRNMKHLDLHFSTGNDFKFVLDNSNNLVSLNLDNVEDIPANIEWPEFPALRELSIHNDGAWLPIILKSKDTLEKLIINTVSSAEYAVEMPRLTDIYMIKDNNREFTNKILRLNCKSLECLYLNENTLADLDSTTIRMNKMKLGVIGKRDTDEIEKERAKLTVMCPNAEILVCGHENFHEICFMVNSRCKSKGFLLDPVRFFSI